jgi:hypothetical protein
MCAMSDPAAILRLRQADLHSRAVDGEVVALDMADSEYLGVNVSGAPLWDALRTGATRDDLVELLRARHQLELADAQRDVDSFLGQLRDRHLLEEAG